MNSPDSFAGIVVEEHFHDRTPGDEIVDRVDLVAVPLRFRSAHQTPAFLRVFDENRSSGKFGPQRFLQAKSELRLGL